MTGVGDGVGEGEAVGVGEAVATGVGLLTGAIGLDAGPVQPVNDAMRALAQRARRSVFVVILRL